ncbi:GAF and ANTAR domain-containing protein [Pseudonocardia petroleophila]|uniref:GAF and ANTAR domain-containing protein n=1 Tax=Pseudonocardia petroleophila TaxID=37331 RepID=UPI0031D982B4
MTPGAATRALLAIDRCGTDAALAERICRACMAGLDVDGAVLSLLTTTGSRTTLWASDATAELIEELQFTLNEGACMEAAATGRPVLVPDLHHGTETARWPVFAAAVAEQTMVSALFALPLQWGAVNLGVLDLYRIDPGGLDAAQYRDALGAADLAALMMLGQRTDPGTSGGADPAGGGWLTEASDHRAEVHQATGMVLAQLGVGSVEALARMRAHAFVEQRLLVDVARDVVARRRRFTEEMR